MSDAPGVCFYHCTGWPYCVCGRKWRQPTYDSNNTQAPPKGCICPPGSEQTCQRWDCGRKNISGSTTFGDRR